MGCNVGPTCRLTRYSNATPRTCSSPLRIKGRTCSLWEAGPMLSLHLRFLDGHLLPCQPKPTNNDRCPKRLAFEWMMKPRCVVFDYEQSSCLLQARFSAILVSPLPKGLSLRVSLATVRGPGGRNRSMGLRGQSSLANQLCRSDRGQRFSDWVWVEVRQPGIGRRFSFWFQINQASILGGISTHSQFLITATLKGRLAIPKSQSHVTRRLVLTAPPRSE